MNQTDTAEPVPGTVDTHAHMVPHRFLDDLAEGRVRFPHVTVTRHESTFRVAFNDGEPTRPVAPGLMDAEKRRAWLDANGVATQVVGGWLDILGYELSMEEGAEWSQLLTDTIAADCRAAGQLLPLGTVPLQSPQHAAEALRQQRADGLPGVMIATRAAGRELSDAESTPFWEAAHETNAVVFLHPGFGASSERYHDYGLVNALARLEDTTVTVARLLYAGIPARYDGARIVVAHAGAALPYVLGRLQRNHALNPQTTHDPSESFARLYFDSVVLDPDALGFLVAKVGAEHVLLGSDYPFPIGDLSPHDVIAGANLTGETRRLVTTANARRLFFGEEG